MDGHRIRSLRFGDAKVKPAARGVFLPEYRARLKSGRRSPLRKVNYCAYPGPTLGEWPGIPRNKIAAKDPC